MRIATWNIHRCVGIDRHCDPARIARVIRSLHCDVIALQEVDDFAGRHDESRQLAYLARATGLTPVAGQTMLRHEGHYGNALLTRCRVHAVRRHDLSVPRREPRGALEVELDVHGTLVRIVATHLGLTQRERHVQVERLRAAVAHDDARDAASRLHRPLVLCGDFNEWRRDGAVLRHLRAIVHDRDPVARAPALRTFHARWPLFALDRLWAQAPLAVSDLRVHRDGDAAIASDHLPLSATLTAFSPSDRRPCRVPSACG